MRKWLILLFGLVVSSVHGAPAWTWVDANGQVHFSDVPVAGAKKIELASAQADGAAPRQSQAQQGAAPGTEPELPAERANQYRTFNITSPAQQETLWATGSVLNVQIELEPRLQPNHRLDLFLDGKRLNLNSTSTSLTVPDVFRGIHTMQAVIVGQRGEEVLRSLATTFMVQQTSIQNPNNANTPSRPPRPTPKSGGN
jgi:Domain of unknown function (DUF4124)